MNKTTGNRLLGESDSPPVEWLNPESRSSVALVCEHAGNAVPDCLNKLGLSAEQLEEHTALDIGAEATARRLAQLLESPLLMQRYSRLVIDCNRPTEAPDSIPELSHGTRVPGNRALNEQQRIARVNEIFAPYDSALGTLLETPERSFAFSIHSFTPSLNKRNRPWDIGLLYRQDADTSDRLCRYLKDNFSGLIIGLNEPYTVDDESDWFVPQHAERLGLNHSLIEIRNDHIQSISGQEHMATILAAAIGHVSSHRLA